ncbi:hypothetical protein HDU79_010503 [Rhizoclosmatium sp. JEL0117]|nr:hypothetical protein HDU79_010503 [Rhizoclosmatium sp. JEL0117]
MKYTTSQLAFGALSLFFFPASAVFCWFLIENTSWCFSDMCIDVNSHEAGPFLKISIFLYYGFLASSLAVVEISRRVPRLHRVLSRTVLKSSSITVGELAFFAIAVIVSFAVGIMGFMTLWWRQVGRAKQGKVLTLQRMIFGYAFNSSGDVLAVLMGFVMIPASKNSFLATFFNLPYTALARIHIWIGRIIWWMTVFHTVDGCIKYVIAGKDVLSLFSVPAKADWGHEKYAGLTGMVATTALLIVTITSLDYFRRRYFNTFFYTHFLVLVFIVFSYLHASNTIYYILPGLLMYTLDGFIRCYSRFCPKDKVKSVVFEQCGYITLTIATKKALNARPGEFMRVCFPEISKIEFHPWSIVRADSESVTFLFVATKNNSKEWTNKVENCLKEHNVAGSIGDIQVCLQGPYGSEIEFLSQLNVGQHDMFVFYVGGTGLAACVQGIEKVLKSSNTKVLLVWSARVVGLEHVTILKELVAKAKEAGSNLIIELYETDGDVSEIDADPIVSKGSDRKEYVEIGFSEYQVNHGRPDFLALLQKHTISELDNPKFEVGVFVCGSEGMTKHALESVHQYRKDNKEVQLDLVVEPFAL